MQLTDYHAKYFAHELTKRCPSDSAEKLAGALVGEQVDLNPHQIEAALFAFKSPLSRGAILADEVGLGKTIETGLVLSQKWAERKRRVLIITPSNLRKQWYQELQEKFFKLKSLPFPGDIPLGLYELPQCLARRTATAALTLEDKLAGQKQVKALEQQRNAKRRALFDAQDEIDRQRERLIAEIEGKLQQRTSLFELFRVRWKLA